MKKLIIILLMLFCFSCAHIQRVNDYEYPFDDPVITVDNTINTFWIILDYFQNK